ncbi:MAG: hypothetical protein ACI9F9_002477 [Candidatus Paceibacteria bacterium]|jgi:hypothetical protein
MGKLHVKRAPAQRMEATRTCPFLNRKGGTDISKSVAVSV